MSRLLRWSSHRKRYMFSDCPPLFIKKKMHLRNGHFCVGWQQISMIHVGEQDGAFRCRPAHLQLLSEVTNSSPLINVIIAPVSGRFVFQFHHKSSPSSCRSTLLALITLRVNSCRIFRAVTSIDLKKQNVINHIKSSEHWQQAYLLA